MPQTAFQNSKSCSLISMLPWMIKMLQGINYTSCSNVALCRSISAPLTILSVALPELGKDDAIHTFMYSLKPCLKGFVNSIVIHFDGTYTKQSDDAGTKVGGKFGVCYTNFLLAPIEEVPIKASPRGGQ